MPAGSRRGGPRGLGGLDQAAPELGAGRLDVGRTQDAAVDVRIEFTESWSR